MLAGGAGGDLIYGKAGNDSLYGDADQRGEAARGDDLLDGGAGTDSVGYEARTEAIVVDLADQAHDGGPRELDLLLDVEDVAGGHGADWLAGDAGANALHGGPGDDVLNGRDGDDSLNDGAGKDALFGGWGDDRCSSQTPAITRWARTARTTSAAATARRWTADPATTPCAGFRAGRAPASAATGATAWWRRASTVSATAATARRGAPGRLTLRGSCALPCADRRGARRPAPGGRCWTFNCSFAPCRFRG